MTLGQALAFAAANFCGVKFDPTIYLSDSDNELVKDLQNKWIHIESTNGHQSILTNAFHPPCGRDCTEEPCLKNNPDFFVSFLIDNLRCNSARSDFTVAQGLNDCFRCFEIFNDVARDFCLSFFALKGRNGEPTSKHPQSALSRQNCGRVP
jgi:hypothetical protein